MATLYTSRTPLGGIDETRLRNLGNKKNVQNGFVPTPTSMKRRREIDSDPAQDPENMDPTLFSPKKAKTGAAPFDKPQHFVLKSTASGPSLTPATRSLITPKRLQNKVERISPISFSAPAAAPAGRSPTKTTKRAGILSKKRSYTRVDPPRFGLNNNSPFSLNAAISGSLGNKVRPTRPQKEPCSLDESNPNGWFFAIHEDSPDDHASNMIQHSTSILDISDEEEKRSRELDERGKENIPPADYAGPGPTRRDAMMDDARLPLGMLNAADFYGAGVDANSFAVIEEDDDKKPAPAVAPASMVETLMDPTPTDAVSTGQDTLNKIMSSIAPTPAVEAPEEPIAIAQDFYGGDPCLEVQSSQEPPIDIWESESAQGDDSEVPEPITVTTPLHQSIAAAEVREDAALEAHTGPLYTVEP